MNYEMVMGLVRHLLTFGGGIVIAKGWADEATVTQIVAGAVALGGVIWSFLSKKPAALPPAA